MATLKSQIQGLIDYANETTGAGDTLLGDAVKTLVEGYGGGEPSIPSNEMWYETTDGHPITPYSTSGMPTIVSNTYEGGKGVIRFASTLTSTGTIFRNVSTLKKVCLAETITTISERAFSDCTYLEDLIGWGHVEKIMPRAFDNTPNFTVKLDCPNLNELRSAAFRGSGVVEVVNLGHISALPGQDGTGHGGFMDCKGLVRVNLPDHLTDFGINAFNGCSLLRKIFIPNTVRYAQERPFDGTNNLRFTINWPNFEKTDINSLFVGTGVTRVESFGERVTTLGDRGGSGYYGFANCTYLEYCVLPASITKLVQNVFRNCSNLVTLVVKATTPPDCNGEGNNFWGCDKLANIYVPDESVDAYKAASVWSNFASIIKPISELNP